MARNNPDHAGAFSSRRLEDAYSANPSPEGLATRQALEQQATRLREQLRQTYGDEIPAYRGQRPVPEDAAERTLLSYTTNPRMAERAVNAPRTPRTVHSDEQIAAFERELQERGEVAVGGTTYRIEDSFTPGEKYVMMYDRAGNEITDAYPDMPSVLRRNNAEASEFNAERQALLDQVQHVNIPVDDVVWATNRFGQQELIARPQRPSGPTAEEVLRQYRD
jgi:hypothetical protein